jgi:hypothetical protein
MSETVVFEHLRSMNFKSHPVWPNSLIARLPGGVQVQAVGRPLYGVILMGHHVGGRSLVEFEERIPLEASRAQVAQAIVRIFEQIGDADPGWKVKHMK